MSNLFSLKQAATRSDLANLLGTDLSNLTYICYGLSENQKYKKFEIDKKNGGKREIMAPEPPLKTIQKRLANILQSCYEEITDKQKSPAHGYINKKSIITNASSHTRRRFVVNIDLRDFFNSITFARIYGFFIKNKHFQLSKEVSSTIAHLACCNGFLPQGSPCSPVISNLIANILDVRISKLAAKAHCKYTRYVDDITFSTNEKSFSELLIKIENDNAIHISPALESTINKTGFSLNINKTRLFYSTSQQEVTGLVVNKKVSIKAKYWREVRAMVNSLCSNGEFKIDSKTGKIQQLRGRLGYINQIDMKNSNFRDKSTGLNQRERTYSKFLFFTRFYFNEKPIILCEGKTDHVYLHSALKNLHLQFPNLIKKEPDGSSRLLIDLYKYKHTESLLLGLPGGSDILRLFIQNYNSNIKSFKAPMSPKPIIIFIDNDKGAKKIYSLLKEIFKSKNEISGNEEYYKVFDKLFIVPTPKINGGHSMIEDFLPSTVLNTVLNGKTFQPDETLHDPMKNYGKAIFADKVVAPNYASIDFSKFAPFLKTISDIVG